MPDDDTSTPSAEPPWIPEGQPVPMPELPPLLELTTEQQYKALSDTLRGQIAQTLRNGPYTAKQLAKLLGVSTGAMGHHLGVLEAAGLIKVVARQQVRGIIARYYARTAQYYGFRAPPSDDAPPMELSMLTQARDELAQLLPALQPDDTDAVWFPHQRMSRDRMRTYLDRLDALVQDFLKEPDDPEGQMFSLIIGAFTSPPAMQRAPRPDPDAPSEKEGDT